MHSSRRPWRWSAVALTFSKTGLREIKLRDPLQVFESFQLQEFRNGERDNNAGESVLVLADHVDGIGDKIRGTVNRLIRLGSIYELENKCCEKDEDSCSFCVA